MSLLNQIINEAVDDKSSLAGVLRKCKVLASRLCSKPLEKWIVWESSGYPSEIEPPDYREIHFAVYSSFIMDGYVAMNGIKISPSKLPADLQPKLTSFSCRSSISYLEKQLSSGSETQQFTFDGMDGLAQMTLGKGSVCIKTWAEYSSLRVVEILNSVRERILDFALAIQKDEPNAGEIGVFNPSPQKIDQYFQLHIAGDFQMGDYYKVGQAGAVGPNSHAHDLNFNQIWTENANEIDLSHLSHELGELKVRLEQRATEPEHQIAIGNVAAAQQAAAQGNGPKVLEFLNNAGKWALDTAKEFTLELASRTLARLVQENG